MKIVLDTDVIIAGMRNSTGASAEPTKNTTLQATGVEPKEIKGLDQWKL